MGLVLRAIGVAISRLKNDSNTLDQQVRVSWMRRVRRVVKRLREGEGSEGPVSFKQRGVAYKTVNESTAGWSSPGLRLNNVEARERAWRGPRRKGGDSVSFLLFSLFAALSLFHSVPSPFLCSFLSLSLLSTMTREGRGAPIAKK